MRTSKLISAFALLVTLVNVIKGQMVTFNEKIIWSTTPDSITLFYPMTDNSIFDEEFNSFLYLNNYQMIKGKYSVSFSNIITAETTSQEKVFLNEKNVHLSDTIRFKMFQTHESDKTTNIKIALLPYMMVGGKVQKIVSYCISLSKYENEEKSNPKTTKSYPNNSVLADGLWIKLTINSTGIHKITATDLSNNGIDTRNLQISDIAIFGNGGGALSENNNEFEYNDLMENSIHVQDENNNGIFDNNDYILFYAQAANIWKFNENTQTFEYKVHPYSKYNYYYLGVNASANTGKRIQTNNIQQSENKTINSYTYCSTIHNDLVNTHKSGRIWVGEKFSSSIPTRNFSFSIPQMIPNSPIKVRYSMASISTTNSSFSITINGESQSHSFSTGNRYYPQGFSRTINSRNSSSCDITMNYIFRENLANGYLDYIEINATSNLSFTNGQLHFRNIENIGEGNVSLFNLKSTPSNIIIWNVSDPCNVYTPATTQTGNTTTFREYTESFGEWIAFDNSFFYAPISISSISNQNLHGIQTVDYVIVSPSVFASQAERLAELHRVYNELDVVVLSPEQIYNEFSSGKQDVIAIRRFMKMMFDRHLHNNSLKKPKYLLLFGKGTFDNKNILESNINSVVSYQSETSFDSEGSSYTSDDMFGYLEDWESGSIYESIDLGIGRFPVKTVDEATAMVDKIENYLSKKDLSTPNVKGDWRNFITFLSDDADPGNPGDVYFIKSTEKTIETISNKYPNYNVEKIYADAYTQQSSAIGSFYPEAKNALTKRINNGCLLLNYVGHGAMHYIGTERYMEKNDISSYSNKYQLPLFVASTCSFGKYDMIDDVCGAESFVLSPNGGGIAIVAAVRPIGHSESFDTRMCLYALDKNNSIGDAFKLAKNETSMTHCMQLLGDPALKLAIPENKIVVTSINGKPIDSLVTDTATVLTKITVEGEIRNNSNQLITDFNGEVYPTVFDRFITSKTLANDNEDTEMEFSQQKNILYKGKDSVKNGKFEYSFIVPRDVAYQYDHGKLSHYAQSGIEDACGFYNNIMFGGFNQDADITESRPKIRLFMNDSLFTSGGITNENPYIYAILFDTLGINAVGSGIGHDITAVLDDNYNQIIILNDYYETDPNNPSKGYIKYPLSDIAEGTHSITLKAWNIYNYSATESILFNVKNSKTQVLGKFYCYPNPSNTKTTLRLEHNQPDSISSIEIVIYDMMGHLAKKFNPTIEKGSYSTPPIVWNFDNMNGIPLSKGFYIAKIIVTFSDGSQQIEHTKIIYSK